MPQIKKVKVATEDLKNDYIEMIQKGFKPAEIEKYVKDVQKDPNADAPKPQGGGTMTVPSAIGSDADNFKGKKAYFFFDDKQPIENDKYKIVKSTNPEEVMKMSKGTMWDLQSKQYAEMYAKDGVYFIFRKGETKPFAAATPDFNTFVDTRDKNMSDTPEGQEIKSLISGNGKQGSFAKRASDADVFKGINKDCKNPKANEDLESLKKNDFDRKTCKGSFSASIDYLAKKDKEEEKDLNKQGFPFTPEVKKKKSALETSLSYLAGESGKHPSVEELEKMPAHQKSVEFSESQFTRSAKKK